MTKLSDLLAGQSNLVTDQDLATVATSGSYSDLTNKPTLSTVATTGSYSDLTNKPTLSTVATTGSYNDLTNKPVIISLKITSISYPGDDLAADPAGGQTITITGSGFVDTPTVYVNDTIAPSVTFVSSTQLTITTPAKTAGTYNLYVINSDGSTAIKVMGISYSGTPAWTTAAGSLGTVDVPMSIQLAATSNSTVTYALTSGSSLPSGVTLSSAGLIEGSVGTEQTFSFSVDATDAENQTTPRSFSVTVSLSDAYFKYVTLLLHGDGTNGAQNNQFLDSSSNNFTITPNGNTTQGSFSPYGSNWSNYFNGSSDYLSLANSTPLTMGTGDFTVEAWVYLPSVSVYSGIVSLGRYQYNGGILRVTSSAQLQWYFNDASVVYITSSATISANTWTHVAVVRSSGTTKLYINGVNSGSSADTSNYNSTYSTLIGADNQASPSNLLAGYISNVRVVKGTAVYTGNFTPSTAPLTAISGTSLLTCQSNRFVDNSTNVATITITGTPSVQRFNPFGTSTAYSTATIGGSGYFDATGDYLSLANTSNLNLGAGDFTLECWFYRVSSIGSTANILWSQWNNNGDSVSQLIANGTACLFRIGANQWTFGSFNKDSWNHVAVSRASGTIRMFVNGTLQSTQSDSTDVTTTSKTVIGCNDLTSGGANFFGGYISGFRQVKGTAVYTAAFTPPTSPPTAITNTQLLLNFTNGAIYDNAMMNDLETVGNAQISTSVKKYGTGSLAFDGNTATLYPRYTANLSLSSGDFTVEAWIYTTNSANYQLIFATGYDTSTSYATIRLHVYSGGIRVLMSTDGSSWQNTSTFGSISNNTWTHIAVVRYGSSVKVYIDGTGYTIATYSGSYYAGAQSFIGNLSNTSSNYPFSGYIDDLRITKGYARYTSTFTPPTAALNTK